VIALLPLLRDAMCFKLHFECMLGVHLLIGFMQRERRIETPPWPDVVYNCPTMLSVRQRWQIVDAYQKHQNYVKVASDLGLNVKTVRLWVGRHALTGDVMDTPRSGRRPALNSAVAAEAKDLLLSGKFAGARDVANDMYKRGKTPGDKPVSRTTLV
jgi:hypothetical protein